MNKKALNLFFISILFLFLVSSVSATEGHDNNSTLRSDSGSCQMVTSDLSNEDIQSLFDNAKSGDAFEFTDKEYNNISLVVDKKLNIISKKNSTIYASNQVNDKAKSMGIEKTFGFYFTSNSVGSVLSGITIIASDSNYGIVADNTKNVQIKDNKIVGGINNILVRNSDKITISGNDLSKTTSDGLQLQNVKNSLIEKNDVSYCKKSGILTNGLYYSNITYNTIHSNSLNGITVNGVSSHNLIYKNTVYDNINGIYINSTSTYDQVRSNSMTDSRRDPRSIMGGDETGNGFLLGSGFKSSGESILKVEHNYFAHNQFFQAKNYWQNENFAMGQNYYNTDDPSNTFVCPRLLASLMKLDSFSVSNTLTFQLRDSSGKAVNDFATFQTRVNVDGNQYTVTFNNGKSTITDVDPNVDHDVEVEMEGGVYKKVAYKASGDEGNSKDSKSSSSDGDRGSSDEGNDGTSEVQGNSNSQGTSTGGDSSGSHVVNSAKSGNYGTNSSDIPSQDTSDNGQDALSNGDLDAGDSGSGEASEEGKAYEIVPPVTTSKDLTNTSGLVVLSILSIMGMLIYGYWRKDEFKE